jgi:hypothetical protein
MVEGGERRTIRSGILPTPRSEDTTMRAPTQPSKPANISLWITQSLLAALFLFAGGMKFIMPVALMTKGTTFTGTFIHFIGAAEVLGGLGLIVPALTRVHRELVTFAAAGLLIIMVGATGPDASQAILPLCVGLMCALVVWGRSAYLVEREVARRSASPRHA